MQNEHSIEDEQALEQIRRELIGLAPTGYEPPSNMKYGDFKSSPQAERLRAAQSMVDTYTAKVLFLEALQVTFSVAKACTKSGVSRTQAYQWKKKDPEFNRCWEDALDHAADNLRNDLYNRARVKDTPAAIFLLKGRFPDEYADRSKVEHSGRIQVELTTKEQIVIFFQRLVDRGMSFTEARHSLLSVGVNEEDLALVTEEDLLIAAQEG